MLIGGSKGRISSCSAVIRLIIDPPYFAEVGLMFAFIVALNYPRNRNGVLI